MQAVCEQVYRIGRFVRDDVAYEGSVAQAVEVYNATMGGRNYMLGQTQDGRFHVLFPNLSLRRLDLKGHVEVA